MSVEVIRPIAKIFVKIKIFSKPSTNTTPVVINKSVWKTKPNTFKDSFSFWSYFLVFHFIKSKVLVKKRTFITAVVLGNRADFLEFFIFFSASINTSPSIRSKILVNE